MQMQGNLLSYSNLDQGQQTVFVNKVLLAHSHVLLFLYCLWLIRTAMTELNSCGRDCKTQKPKILTNLALEKKKVPVLNLVYNSNHSSLQVHIYSFASMLISELR
jgi:hypothetical protein